VWTAQRRRVLAPGVALAWTLLALPSRLYALNPALDISQYAHTAWTIRGGFFSSPVSSIAQTPDGYLWLGTASGLLRFDGVRLVRWQPRGDEQLPSPTIRKLLVTHEGRLWIGTLAGLASWKDGRLVTYPEFAGQPIASLVEDSQRTVWAGTITVPNARLCAIRTSVECVGQDGRFGLGVFSLFEEPGRLWVGAASGLWRWVPGDPRRYPTPTIRAFATAGDGPLLIAMSDGIRRLVGDRLEPYPIRGINRPLGALQLLADRDGGVWIGTQVGLVHVHDGQADLFTRADGLSGDYVEALFEDREGNVWVATNEGLDRFRELAVTSLARGSGMPTDLTSSVLRARDGAVWIGTPNGLIRWNAGRTTVYRTRDGLPDDRVGTLFEDSAGRILVATLGGMAVFDRGTFAPLRSVPTRVVYGIVEAHPGEYWISDQEQGLIHLIDEKVVDRMTWSALGHDNHATALAFDKARTGLWLGFYNGGVVFLRNGTARESYGTAEGLGAGRVSQLQFDADGALWAATAAGLSRINNSRITTLTTRNGLPCDAVHWTIADGDRSRWLSMSCGLARISSTELDAWIADPNRSVKTDVLDGTDGVRTVATPIGFSPPAARVADGRLWFAAPNGVGVVDPRRLPFNTLPPAVHIEQIVADRQTYDTLTNTGEGVRLPPLVRDLQIDYTALSFVAPEKVRFRYQLEGYDPDWEDVGTRRQAFYNDLPPGNYRFRVTASNNSGVWNETGAFLDFSVAPAYYQTVWFRGLVLMVAATLLWAGYRYRLRQVAYEFDARLHERVNERTRIARELHDTLLQSFHGLLFRFQAANNMLPDRPGEARQKFESAIDQAAQALTEGRDAVQNLRLAGVDTTDLAVAITTLSEELSAADTDGIDAKPVVNVAVSGTPRDLHAVLRDDIYRIAGEALRNAFRHSHARHIEVEVRYDEKQLQLRVRDDGNGIDVKVLEERKAGHFGLPGMRERAELIGGHLDVWSQAGIGTEVDLKVPGYAAYAAPRSRSRVWPFAGRIGPPS
jgi:signal transduction histidine kinase/ligand-binding sensor domain-containing protein